MDQNALETMLQKGQDNLLMRYTFGSLSFKKGDYEAAIEHLSKALEFDSTHLASWKLYGRALAEAGKTEESINAFNSGIQIAEKRGDIQAAKEMKVFLKRLTKT